MDTDFIKSTIDTQSKIKIDTESLKRLNTFDFGERLIKRWDGNSWWVGRVKIDGKTTMINWQRAEVEDKKNE